MAVDEAVGRCGKFGVGSRGAANASEVPAQRCSNAENKAFGSFLGQIIEAEQALAEAVTTTSAGKNQRHRSRRDAAGMVAHQPLNRAGLPVSGPGPGGRSDSLFVGSP